MLSHRFKYDGRPAVKMNRLQFLMKKKVDEKVENKIYLLENVPCCVCNCEEFEALSEKDRYGLYMSVVACKRCGLIQTNPRMTGESYNVFYNEEYRRLYDGKEGPDSRFFAKQYKMGGEIYSYLHDKRLIDKGPRDLFVCEVGCSAGGILRHFKEKGCRIFGTDVSEGYMDYGRKMYNLDLMAGSIFDVQLASPPDLVIYSHVLEHLLSPKEELARLRRILHPGGILYIQLPGVKNLYNTYDMDFLKYLQNAHTYHFTLTTLKNLLAASGFDFICGDEIIRSAWKLSAESSREIKLEDDYQPVISYLKGLEGKTSATKAVFIVPYPTEGPSTRYRVEQFIPHFEKNGIKCSMRPFMSKGFYEILYKNGRLAEKIFYFAAGAARRLRDVFAALKYDIIFIHLEAFPLGPPLIEYFWAFMGKVIVYDLDDAIYMKDKISPNRALRFFKCSFKVRHIIRLSRHVIVCNQHLKDYARQFTADENIDVIHTAVDTEKFIPRPRPVNGRLVLGWIGSNTTSGYICQIEGVLGLLAGKYDFLLKIVGAGRDIEIPGVQIENARWSLDKDVENFQSLNIGIYPLPENEWARGKTGFKAIQYMAAGVPCVASNVGSNRDIIEDGKNGFLAANDEQWVEKLSLLIEDSGLRQKIAAAGRKTAEERFSVAANFQKYLEIFKQIK